MPDGISTKAGAFTEGPAAARAGEPEGTGLSGPLPHFLVRLPHFSVLCRHTVRFLKKEGKMDIVK